MPENTKFETVAQYISTFPEPVQLLLEQIRRTIQENAPEAEEVISYNIPAFKYHGMLIFYSAYQKHVSISTAPFAVFEMFAKELAPYKRSKSTVQLPLHKPLPLELIAKMTQFRLKENLEIAEEKAKKKKK